MTLLIEGYEIGEKIGQGGMAEVYRARHLRLERDVAIKVMLRRYSDAPDFAERFIREARIAANLNHPNIVQIYDVDKSNDCLFIAMEYVTGGDLTKKLTEQPDKETAVEIFTQLCAALDYAHGQGYIHRDIKPANILFRDNGSLALSDFGIARAIHSDTNMTATGMVIGTPSYISPEQAQSLTLDSRADLYSTAVIAYQFITGQLPYEADSSISLAIKHIRDPIPELPGPLAPMQSFFNTALAKDPEERFANGKAFMEAFRQAVADVDTKSYTEFTTVLAERLAETGSQSESATPVSGHSGAADFLPATPKPIGGGQTSTGAEGKPDTLTLSVSKSNFIRFLLVGAVVAVLAGGGWYLLPTETETVSLSPAEQARLTQMINAADQALSDGRLIAPSGNNAHDHFQGIMELSPNDPVALEGLQQVNTRLTEKGRDLIARGELSTAEALIHQMKTRGIDAAAYSELELALSNARQNQKQQAEQLQSEVLELLAANDIDAAASKYKEIDLQHLNPEQRARVRQALTETSNLLIDQARASVDNNQLESAEQALDQADKIVAAMGDQQLANDVAAVRNRAENKAGQIERESKFQQHLLAADSAFIKGNLVSPASASAWHHYNQALRIKPGNSQAKRGLAKVTQSLADRAGAEINAGEIAQARSTIADLERVDSKHSALAQLKRDIATKQRDLERSSKNEIRIQQYLAKAQVNLDRNKPHGAYKMWDAIASLDPDHPSLKELSAKIADGYVYLAQREIDAKDWKDVEVWVEKGLRHVPDHEKLLEQRKLAEEKLKQGCGSLFKRC
jgi:serine/threonine protein kinase